MSKTFQRVDKETLKRDEALYELMQQIKEKVLQGHIIELKTLTRGGSSASYADQQSIFTVKQNDGQLTQRVDIDGIVNSTERESHQLLDQTFNKKIIGPNHIFSQVQQIDKSCSSSFSNQSFYSDEEPFNIDFIKNNLLEMEQQLNCQTSAQIVLATKTLFEQIKLLINRNIQKKNFLSQYTVLAVRCLLLLGNSMMLQGAYGQAILYYENCLQKFHINNLELKGKLLIKIGEICFLNNDFQKSQQYFYDALLHYEQLGWKLNIAIVLNHLARLNGWIKNLEIATKLCYEALALFREFLSDDDTRIGDSYFILAEIAYHSKDINQAFSFAEQSISIKEQNEKNKENLSQIYNLLGILYTNNNDFKSAALNFQKALQFCEKDEMQKAQLISNWAVIQAFGNNYELAQKGFIKAKDIHLQFSNKNTIYRNRLEKNRLELLK